MGQQRGRKQQDGNHESRTRRPALLAPALRHRTMDGQLKRLRERIEREVPFVGRKPYSHNIIGLTLNQIAGEYGVAEANRAMRDFGLEKLGWREVREE